MIVNSVFVEIGAADEKPVQSQSSMATLSDQWYIVKTVINEYQVFFLAGSFSCDQKAIPISELAQFIRSVGISQHDEACFNNS